MKKLFALILTLVLIFSLCACNNSQLPSDKNQQIQSTDNQQHQKDTPVCSSINLCYHGNKNTSVTIEDDTICSELIAFITRADGTKGESSKGYYGVPYTLTIYFEENEEPLIFCLWSESQYSTSQQKDAEGYQYFFKDDLSDLYQYLEEKYPDEFWYPDVNLDN